MTATIAAGTVTGSDPMGAAGPATDLPPVKSSTITTEITTKGKGRGPKAEDPEAPRRASLVKATFDEAEKAKVFISDAKGKATAEEITEEGALKVARRNKACDALLMKAEGKDGAKFKSGDFKGVSEYFGGAKSYFYMRKRYYESKVKEMQDKIDGKTSTDPMAIAKKAAKAKAELSKLLGQLGDIGLDLKSLGLE